MTMTSHSLVVQVWKSSVLTVSIHLIVASERLLLFICFLGAQDIFIFIQASLVDWRLYVVVKRLYLPGTPLIPGRHNLSM